MLFTLLSLRRFQQMKPLSISYAPVVSMVHCARANHPRTQEEEEEAGALGGQDKPALWLQRLPEAHHCMAGRSRRVGHVGAELKGYGRGVCAREYTSRRHHPGELHAADDSE